MLPSFDIQDGFLLVAARALSDAALLSVFGTLAFRAVVGPRCFERMPAALADHVKRRLVLFTQTGVCCYVGMTLVWLILQSANLAGAGSAAQALGAVPEVAFGTEFGRLVVLQLAAMALVSIAAGVRDVGWRQWSALASATVATVLQSGHSHAAAMYSGPSVLLASDILHLLAAGAWLGGLLPLLMVVRTTPPGAGATAARGFAPLGKLCVVMMAGTGAYQGFVLIASVPGLVGTAYGWMALVKLALFSILLGFALTNRYRLAPALRGKDPDRAKRALIVSIAMQSCFGLAVVGAAAGLSGLEPAMHLQPLWPFAKRLSLEAVGEDADFRMEAIGAGLALAVGAALLILGIAVRRLRWPAIALAAVIAWFAIPHLDVLLAEAYPTYYYVSPTGFAASSIVAGAALYPQNCSACHGVEGHGDGPAAAGLPVPPADLGAAHLWMHSDGELFWWLSHGIEAPDGRPAMPGFASVLSEDQRWAVIDFIRARNAGQAFAASGTWPVPVRAPGFQADGGGKTLSSSDLQGEFVRLVFSTPPAAATGNDAMTVIVANGGTAPAGMCLADDESLYQAYSIVSGLPARSMVNTQFLIDGSGWLRAVQPGGWTDLAALHAEIEDLKQHPIAAPAAMPAMDMKM